MNLYGHEQTMVKVNAPCDIGVAPLVKALNEIEGLRTLDSCQSDELGKAYVYFTYGGCWCDLANLLQAISTELSTRPLQCGFQLSLEWFGSNEMPRAQVRVSPEHVGEVAEQILAVCGSISRRMSWLVCGISGKALRS